LLEGDMKHDQCTCTVEVSPDEVDAGADITLQVRAACPREGGLRAPSVSIRDPGDAELARAELTSSEDGDYQSNDIVLASPCAVGEHVYRAVLVAADKDGALQEQASTEVRFVVKLHAALLNVWGLPSAVVAGDRFSFTVGAKCSAGCNLSGHKFSILGHDGSEIRAAKLGGDIWPGTDALYFAEIEAQAPPAAGNHRWEVKTAAWDSELPHAAGASDLIIKVVDAPDCEVTVEAVDREKQAPIKDARVVMHPFRAITDANGIARLKVTKGQYDILVSASKYIPLSTSVEVTADMISKAELDEDQPWVPPDEALD
jgi:hypothetical protein